MKCYLRIERYFFERDYECDTLILKKFVSKLKSIYKTY